MPGDFGITGKRQDAKARVNILAFGSAGRYHRAVFHSFRSAESQPTDPQMHQPVPTTIEGIRLEWGNKASAQMLTVQSSYASSQASCRLTQPTDNGEVCSNITSCLQLQPHLWLV